jgi:hypothetical protein
LGSGSPLPRTSTTPGRRKRLAALVGLLFATALVVAPAAHGSDRIYWSNFDIGKISYANLDGSGGGDLATGAATVDGPMGIAIDPAAGRIYWSNWGYKNYIAGRGTKISWANLDGSGGGDLDTGDATVEGPHGVAIDPVAGRIYWANYGPGSQGTGTTISYANLDGSGGGDLNTTGATVSGPRGVAVDPAAGKIYWANYGDGYGTTISSANLDGSGGGDLMTVGATVEGPEGVALDPTANKIFWGNYGTPDHGDTIAYANLDGSGDAHDLSTAPITPHRVHGVAIDKTRGKIYWANYGDTAEFSGSISSANLDGTGGGANLVTTGASMNGPELPALLEVPKATKAPAVSGSTALGSSLSCTQGTWAPDDVEALLYRAPHDFSYRWTLNGRPIPGATSSSTKVSGSGTYRCQVTAHNAAGSRTQPSPPLTVPDHTPPRTTITQRPKPKLRTRNRTIKVEVRFTSEAGATFKCRLDDSPFKSCTSPYDVRAKSRRGNGMSHTIAVEAIDKAGNVGQPATVSFRVIRVRRR